MIIKDALSLAKKVGSSAIQGKMFLGSVISKNLWSLKAASGLTAVLNIILAQNFNGQKKGYN